MPLFHTMGLRSLLATVLAAGTWVPQAKFDADVSLDLITEEKVSALYLVPTIFWALLADRPSRRGHVGAQAGVRRGVDDADPGPEAGRDPEPRTVRQPLRQHRDLHVLDRTRQRRQARVRRPCGRLLPGPPRRSRPRRPPGPDRRRRASRARSRSRWTAPRRSPATGTGRTPTRSRSATGGTSPATWPPPTRTATCWVSGRVDDMINSGGENIYPDEIENALAGCPDLDEVIVVGTPHDKWGHAVTAFVVGPAGADPKSHARRRSRPTRATPPACRR